MKPAELATRVPTGEALLAVATVDLARDQVVASGDDDAFHVTGARVVGELRCSDCGYGIVSRGALPSCPMCRGSSWEESQWRPFTRGSR